MLKPFLLGASFSTSQTIKDNMLTYFIAAEKLLKKKLYLLQTQRWTAPGSWGPLEFRIAFKNHLYKN